MTQATMKINALAQWYGSARSIARTIGAQLGKLDWCGVPFAGGMSELPHIRTRGGVANDLHRHIINLARVIRDDDLRAQLIRKLEGMLFHPDELCAAQVRCIHREEPEGGLFGTSAPRAFDEPDVGWAADYFVASWMGRGGQAGRHDELRQGLSMRWTTSGGDSAKRFRSAVESLPAWGQALGRWSFYCSDAFTFLGNVKDEPRHGLYVDAPWPDAGDEYKHRFTERDQVRLAGVLGDYTEMRVVVRFGDHPLIRRLYPRGRWTWITQESVNQRGGTVSEVLIVNGPAHGGGS